MRAFGGLSSFLFCFSWMYLLSWLGLSRLEPVGVRLGMSRVLELLSYPHKNVSQMVGLTSHRSLVHFHVLKLTCCRNFDHLSAWSCSEADEHQLKLQLIICLLGRALKLKCCRNFDHLSAWSCSEAEILMSTKDFYINSTSW